MLKKRSNRLIKIVILVVAFLMLISIYSNFYGIFATNNLQKFEYTESTDFFNNPDIGIYRPTAISCKAEGEWPNIKIQYPNGLVHLRLGLKSFSKLANGVKDYDITSEHIQKLNEYLDQVRQAGGTAIVRFAYDDFIGTKNLEPEMDVILKHIEQLKPFFEANEDIIACVETGFLGPYGEQHSSTIVNKENVGIVARKLAEVVPQSKTVSVRKPLWYCGAAGIDLDTIDSHIPSYDSLEYRIGMFNDGYLGSNTDLGSFVNREKALDWISNQATHTLYGGEVSWVSNDLDENGYMYHSLGHIQDEMFKTHTAYINEEWNRKVLNEWKEDTYTGEDTIYNGLDGYTYVKNHLGYRFVLNTTQMPKEVKQNATLNIDVNLKNVGAGNVVNEKATYIVLKSSTREYVIPTDIDVRKWLSRQTQDFTIPVSISEDIDVGMYDVYLKITNKGDNAYTNLRTIRFANNEDVWDSELGANKIGNVRIVKEDNFESYNNKTGLYLWGIDDIDYSSLNKLVDYLNIDTLYVGRTDTNEERDLNSYSYELLFAFSKKENLKSYIVYDEKYGKQSENLEKVKGIIDQVVEYNSNSNYKISGIAIDSEFHTTQAYANANHDQRVLMFKEYVDFMIEACNYANEKGLKYVSCISTDYDQYLSETELERLIKDGCDYVQLMNYDKEQMITSMSLELELAKKYNKPIESIAELQKPGHNGVDEYITYYYEGLDACTEKFKEIEREYKYKELHFAYHYYNPVLELSEEILDYTKDFNYELYPKNEQGESIKLDKVYLVNGADKTEGITVYNKKSNEYITYFYGVEYLKNYTLQVEDGEYEFKDIKNVFYSMSNDTTKYDEIVCGKKVVIPDEPELPEEKEDSKVIVKYLEEGTNKELLASIELCGKVDENYISEDKIEQINNENGNKYVLQKIEGNIEGKYTKEEQIIKYYYSKKQSKITIRYIEKETGNKLLDDLIVSSKIDDSYNTLDRIQEINNKNQNKYELLKVEGEVSGYFSLEEKEIIYYYTKKGSKVIVRYLEVGTNKELLPNVKLTDKIDSFYTSEDKIEEINSKFENTYKLTKIEGEKNGVYTINETIVIYWYEQEKEEIPENPNEEVEETKYGKIIIKYLDIDSNKELIEDVINEGKVEEEYNTLNMLDKINEMYFNKYEFVKVDGNEAGEYKEETQIITYYYVKKLATIVIKYVEEGTCKELLEELAVTSKVDEKYYTTDRLDEINSISDKKYKVSKIYGEENGVFTVDSKMIVYWYKEEEKLPEKNEEIQKVPDVLDITELPATGGNIFEAYGKDICIVVIFSVTLLFFWNLKKNLEKNK